jgi:DUF971 family protein
MQQSSQAGNRWPTQLRLKAGRRELEVRFDDGLTGVLPAELLRVHSPSAEVQGHGAGQKKLVRGKQNVQISAIERVGSYAVRLVFDDGHDSGFYTFPFLEDFVLTLDAKRLAYENEKAAASQGNGLLYS